MKLKHDAKALWQITKEAAGAWSDDNAPSMGAALAYYTVFSIAPLLVIAIAVAGLVFGQEAARGQIFAQLSNLIGDEGGRVIEGLVKSASSPGKSIFGTVLGVLTLLIGATTVFSELQADINRIWEVPPAKHESGLWNLLRRRILTFGMVLGIGFLLLVSLILSAAISAFGTLFAATGWEILLQAINFVIGLAVATGLFAMIYKVLPSVKIGWHDVWIGAAVTALLFSIGKIAIGLYLGKTGVVSGFGAAGSLVVLLIWMYYSAQIFLLGAEFTWVYAHRYGSRAAGPQAQAHSADTAPQEPAPVPFRSKPAPAFHATRPASAWVTLARRRPALAVSLAAALGIAIGDLVDRLPFRLGRRSRL